MPHQQSCHALRTSLQPNEMSFPLSSTSIKEFITLNRRMDFASFCFCGVFWCEKWTHNAFVSWSGLLCVCERLSMDSHSRKKTWWGYKDGWDFLLFYLFCLSIIWSQKGKIIKTRTRLHSYIEMCSVVLHVPRQIILKYLFWKVFTKLANVCGIQIEGFEFWRIVWRIICFLLNFALAELIEINDIEKINISSQSRIFLYS